MVFVLVIAGMLAVGFFNGANDVSKSIATLVGSGVTRYRTAVVWGSIWTFAGGAFAAIAAQGLVAAFSGKGVLVAVPDSPTHVSSAAIVGIGLRRNAHDVSWKTVGEMLLAWIVTLPTAAAIAAATYIALQSIS